MFKELAGNMQVKHIIWDWNGTLLDDVSICIDCINMLLSKRNLPVLDIEKYRQIFTFPVREYYVEAGFDFNTESFDLLAVEFIENYRKLIRGATIFTDVKKTLDTFNSKGMNQYIVSAMEQDFLMDSVAELGLTGYFKVICGISDHHAESKSNIAGDMLQALNLDKMETIFIGDTLHDYEVASENGIQSILVNRGHQSFERLQSSGQPVVRKLQEIANYFDTGYFKNYS